MGSQILSDLEVKVKNDPVTPLINDILQQPNTQISAGSPLLKPNDNQTNISEILLKQSEAMIMVAKGQLKTSRPKYELQIFDGSDLTRFRSFMQDFKSMIAVRCDADTDKLHYLQKYTSGLPL